MSRTGPGMALCGGPPNQCRITGMPSQSEGPSGGARAFCLLLGCSKVRRRKGATLSRRYRNNGYVRIHLVGASLLAKDHNACCLEQRDAQTFFASKLAPTSSTPLWLWLLILIFSAPSNHAGRNPMLIGRGNRQDAGLAALGQGWPFAATLTINVGLRACRAKARHRVVGQEPFAYFWAVQK